MTLHESLVARLESLEIDPAVQPGRKAWRALLADLDEDYHEASRERTQLRSALQEASNRLALALREVEAANLAKRNFLATVGHELRTPMNGILGMSSLLYGTTLTAQQEEYADAIQSSANQLVALIEQILEFPRLDAGNLAVSEAPFDLAELLDGLAEYASTRARDQGLEFAALLYRDLPQRVIGDLNRLRQVLLHLLDNAVKFTAQGEVLLRARTVATSPDAIHIRFEVADTGIGMDADACKRAFEPFCQIDDSASRPYPGTGLGLAICHRIVSLLNGRIGVSSEPGKGSTFWFELPFRTAAPQAREAAGAADLAGARALIVAANPAQRTAIHHELSAWGVLSVVAQDAVKAMELMRAAARRGSTFDYVLVDAMVAGRDGLELAEAVQVDPELTGTPVVVFASLGLDTPGGELRQRGVAAWMTKPVEPALLYECLRRIRRAPEREVPAASAPVAQTVPMAPVAQSVPVSLAARVAPVSPEVGPPPVAPVAAPPPVEPGSAPAPVAPPPQPFASPEPVVSAAEPPALTGPRRLLIVEDNAVNQKVAMGIVKRMGFEADVAVHGLKALEAIDTDQYDAVLMDCQMPVMDGYQATREIRLRESGKRRLPIIAFTANADQGDRERCMEAGMDDYITKPVKPDELLTTIQRWVRAAEPPQPVSPPVPEAPPVAAPPPVASVPEPEPEPEEPAVDLDVIAGLRELQEPGEPDLLDELVGLFLEDGPSALGTLRQAVAAGDAALAKRTAHTLKGCAANIGAKPLAELCGLVERQAAGEVVTGLAPLTERIATELERVMGELQRLTALTGV